jgi:hypothetical protein
MGSTTIKQSPLGIEIKTASNAYVMSDLLTCTLTQKINSHCQVALVKK